MKQIRHSEPTSNAYIGSWSPTIESSPFSVINKETCKHFASVKMPGLKNRRECVLCHKFFDDED